MDHILIFLCWVPKIDEHWTHPWDTCYKLPGACFLKKKTSACSRHINWTRGAWETLKSMSIDISTRYMLQNDRVFAKKRACGKHIHHGVVFDRMYTATYTSSRILALYIHVYIYIYIYTYVYYIMYIRIQAPRFNNQSIPRDSDSYESNIVFSRRGQ